MINRKTISRLGVITLMLLLSICGLSLTKGTAQETIFTLFKKKEQQAHEAYNNNDFSNAKSLYQKLYAQDASGANAIQLARCYYGLHNYDSSASWFETAKGHKVNITGNDLLKYADALVAAGQTAKAKSCYERYAKESENNHWVLRKIWQLQNINSLYQDSSFFAIRPLSINSSYNEMAVMPYRDGVVFSSNRKKIAVVDHVDTRAQAPFYKLYYAKDVSDTSVLLSERRFTPPQLFMPDAGLRLHEGPVAFYNNGNEACIAANTSTSGEAIGLFFAKLVENHWQITHAFPYNTKDGILSEPAISEDGLTLIFSASINGGFGGRDLYRSFYKNGSWSKPENLGPEVNTIQDERFPYLVNSTLYFSSNGLGGLGGLDVFRLVGTFVNDQNFEVQDLDNMGYPVNSNGDDFAFTLINGGTRGYLTSNRGHRDDNIYEFEMDLQPYPVEIQGIVRMRNAAGDREDLEILQQSDIILIDYLRHTTISATVTDMSGRFVLNIPNFSKYGIKVITKNGEEYLAALEMPKQRKSGFEYDIIVVKGIKDEAN